MAFPVVEAGSNGRNESSATTHSVTLPAGVAAGDLLLIFFATRYDTAITGPAGWTQVFQPVYSTYCRIACFSIIASGGETLASVTTAGNTRTGFVCYRISGASGNVEFGSAVFQTGSHDVAPVTASWGVKDNLFLAMCGKTEANTLSYWPSTHTLHRTKNLWLDGNAANVFVCARTEAVATHDAGSFTFGGLSRGIATPLVVEPGGSPPAPGQLPLINRIRTGGGLSSIIKSGGQL